MYFNLTIKLIVTTFLLFLVVITIQAQPVFSRGERIKDWTIINDLSDSLKYYYLPGPLILDHEPGGRPKFNMISFRKTGTQLTSGSSDIKSFMNILEIGVRLISPTKDQLQEMINVLPSNASLVAMPLQKTEAFLIIPATINNTKKKQIGTSPEIQDDLGIWEEKVFTIRLQDYEFQLLSSQIQSGKLIASLHYTHYALGIVPGGNFLSITSDSKMELPIDTSKVHESQVQIVHSEDIPLYLDQSLFSDLVRKIDINEGLPPAYATIEIRCNDFSMELRPDLALKNIDIKATSVSGQEISIPAIRFLKSEPTKTVVYTQFPYPVSVEKPLQFRVQEISRDGEVIGNSSWQLIDNWNEIIDITTPASEINKEFRSLDIELNWSDSTASLYSMIGAVLEYSFNKKLFIRILPFTQKGLQTVDIWCDKNSSVSCYTFGTANNKRYIRNKKKIASDNYYFSLL